MLSGREIEGQLQHLQRNRLGRSVEGIIERGDVLLREAEVERCSVLAYMRRCWPPSGWRQHRRAGATRQAQLEPALRCVEPPIA